MKFTGKTSDYQNKNNNSTNYNNINGTNTSQKPKNESGYRYEPTGTNKDLEQAGQAVKKVMGGLFHGTKSAIDNSAMVAEMNRKATAQRIRNYGKDTFEGGCIFLGLLGGFALGFQPIVLPFAVLPIGIIIQGLLQKKQALRMTSYNQIFYGKSQFKVARLRELTNIPEATIKKDLEVMIRKGLVKQGFLDHSNGTLVLENMTEYLEHYVAPQVAEPEPSQTEENSFLVELHQVNKRIENPKMSEQIDHIVMIAGKILAFQEEETIHDKELHRFLSYYLPTTLKLLQSYGELESQNIEGANISKSKAQIEAMVDKIVESFEKQLDQLFQNDTIDIATDIAVLEQMFEKDGLSGNILTLDYRGESPSSTGKAEGEINLKL